MVQITKVAAAVSSGSTALSKLCEANLGVLTQKLGLVEAMIGKHGEETALQLFQTTCPLVKASVGQHFRHSLDHMELAVNIAEKPMGRMPELHYDLRERGCGSENDMHLATQRILDVIHKLNAVSIMDEMQQSASSNTDVMPKQQMPAKAYFMLSGASDTEYALTTSIGRELGFAAHHAIHHMALVKLIATQTLGMDETDLPPGFGRAPSTINFESATTEES